MAGRFHADSRYGAVWLTGLALGDDGTEDFGLHMSEALLAANL